MVVVQALTWEARDLNEDHVISIFGKTLDGKSVCVSTVFEPYFLVKLPKGAHPVSVYSQLPKDLVTSYEVTNGKDMWGFQNGEIHKFMKITCPNLKARRSVQRYIKHKKFEANLDPVLRLMHRTGIESSGWFETGEDCIRAHYANVDIDLFCNNWKTLKPVTIPQTAPFNVASLDIECYSSTGKFPDADVPGDVCFQIAVSLCKFGKDVPYKKVCFCLKETDNTSGDIQSFKTEKEMLEAFGKFVNDEDIDIITGWNIFGFDLEYIYKRACFTRCDPVFFNLGKLKDCDSEIIFKKLSSSALGDNTLKLLPMSGRFIFDLFHEIKREYKLDSYKLDYVSKYYLNDQKIDMPPKEMFVRFKEGDPVKLSEVAEYCIKDTLLPHRLLSRLSTLVNLLEMGKATWVPLCYLVERGQQIKVFSQICKKAREKGFFVPTLPYGTTDNTAYEGATVLEAQTGAYYTPITALDFASLYPSIMMAHNLCYSSLVMDPKYDNLPGVNYETFGAHKFAQNVDSVLPEILSELKVFRKVAKKDMANATTDELKNMYNGKQLAYKISMNSVYGFTGASKGILPCVAIASTVTRKGRNMIEETKDYVEANFPGAKVRYGDTDSVMVEFDVGDRKGMDAIKYSWELGEKAAEECTKLFKKPNDLELEKVYWPYFLYSKKRYAAKLWEQDKNGEMKMKYIDVKGLQLVRRDNTLHVREVSKELLDVILESNDTEGPKELARLRANELLSGQVPMEKLILSQQLGESYKNENLAHVKVRDKMKERQPGSEPQSGDRVPYVLLKTEDSKAKAYEKAEDPKFTKENNLEIDYHYYFVNKFLNPVCDLLEPLFGDPKSIIFEDIINQHKPPRKTKAKKETGKQMKLSDMNVFKQFER